MTLSVGTGDYYNYNNNQVKVPYRAQEEQPEKDEVVIPYRRQDDAEPANEDKFEVTKKHGAGVSAGYSTVEGPVASLQPYRYDVEISNEDHTTKFSVGPEIKVTNMGTESVSSLSILPGEKTTGIAAGVALSGEVSKKVSEKNTNVFGSLDTGVRYQYVVPSNKPGFATSVEQMNPSASAVDLNIDGRVGVDFNPDDKNSVRLFTFGKFQSFLGVLTQKIVDEEDGVYYDEPAKRKTNQTTTVQSVGGGLEYTRKLDKGEFSVEASGGYGLKNSKNLDYNSGSPVNTRDKATGAFGSVTVKLKL